MASVGDTRAARRAGTNAAADATPRHERRTRAGTHLGPERAEVDLETRVDAEAGEPGERALHRLDVVPADRAVGAARGP